MDAFFLPVLSHFQNGNFWTASGGILRYRVLPEEDALTAEVWEGPWSYQDSQVEEKRSFPMSEEGLEALRRWLADWRTAMDARPKRSLDETIRLRDELRARRAAEQAGAAGEAGK